MTRTDAVVIGSGPNGLVAANLLADAGWDVVLLEAQDGVGGAVRSDSGVRDGFVRHVQPFYPSRRSRRRSSGSGSSGTGSPGRTPRRGRHAVRRRQLGAAAPHRRGDRRRAGRPGAR